MHFCQCPDNCILKHASQTFSYLLLGSPLLASCCWQMPSYSSSPLSFVLLLLLLLTRTLTFFLTPTVLLVRLTVELIHLPDPSENVLCFWHPFSSHSVSGCSSARDPGTTGAPGWEPAQLHDRDVEALGDGAGHHLPAAVTLSDCSSVVVPHQSSDHLCGPSPAESWAGCSGCRLLYSSSPNWIFQKDQKDLWVSL